MYVASPPASRATAHGTLLRLSRARRAVFSGSSAAASPGLREYLTDLVRPAGLRLAEEDLAAGRGHSYGEMGAELIEKLVPPSEPVGLLVLAFSVPDAEPGRATASYLSRVCPGEPMAFAICDQGSAAPFTGLRIAAEYSHTGGCHRTLLLVTEQAVLHHEPAGPACLPACHAAVALLFASDGPVRLSAVRQRPAVASEAAVSRLAGELAAFTGDGQLPVLVIGNGLAALPGARDLAGVSDIRMAPAGQPATGLWWELARVLSGWPGAAGCPVVLADYEPALGYLSVSAWR
jgi:hypothetical protein